MELFQYAFFQYALLGSLFTAIACGIVGTYIVSRRLVFISGGITHASFGGLGLGFYTGMNPIVSAMLFAILAAFGVEWASRTQQIREDSAIAGVWSLGMALGVIFIFLTPGYAPNLSEVGKERLSVIRSSTDGFEIARQDLRLRGPGEFMGAKQSGAPLLRFADLDTDVELLDAARQAAQTWLTTDPKSALQHARRWFAGSGNFLQA